MELKGIWTQVCPVKVQNAKYYTIEDCCGRVWILNKNDLQKIDKEIWPLKIAWRSGIRMVHIKEVIC